MKNMTKIFLLLSIALSSQAFAANTLPDGYNMVDLKPGTQILFKQQIINNKKGVHYKNGIIAEKVPFMGDYIPGVCHLYFNTPYISSGTILTLSGIIPQDQKTYGMKNLRGGFKAKGVTAAGLIIELNLTCEDDLVGTLRNSTGQGIEVLRANTISMSNYDANIKQIMDARNAIFADQKKALSK